MSSALTESRTFVTAGRGKILIVSTSAGSAREGQSGQSGHIHLCLPEREPHVHLSVHRCGRNQMLARQILLADVPIQLREAGVAMGDEWSHATLFPQR
jgi:hypothetical protein